MGLGSEADTGEQPRGEGANEGWARSGHEDVGGTQPVFPPFLFVIVDASTGLLTNPPAVRPAAWVPDHHAGESSVQMASQGSLGCPPQGRPPEHLPRSCHPLVDTCGSAGGHCARLAGWGFTGRPELQGGPLIP